MSSVKDLLRGDVVDGSGTANYVTKWSDADTIGNSVIYEYETIGITRIGIGTTTPAGTLTVTDGNDGLEIGNEGEVGATRIFAFDRSATSEIDLIYRAEVHRFQTAATEKMRIDSSGNVGIGTSSPANKLHVVSATGYHTLDSTGGVSLIDFRTTGNTTQGGVAIGADATNTLSFRTASTERMTIDASGNIGAPTGTNIYNASDARLKQNIVSIENGLDTIYSLNPVKFNWIDGFSESERGKDMLGFVAQEVQQVLPEAVESFSNNSLDVAGEIIDNPLRVNEKFIIPVLVKAIQEQQEIINELKSRIETLEAK